MSTSPRIKLQKRDDREQPAPGPITKISANLPTDFLEAVRTAIAPGGTLRAQGIRDVTSAVEYGLRLALQKEA